MTKEQKLDFKIGLYGRMQLEMIANDLLTKDGVPIKKKNMSSNEDDAIRIYDHLSYDLKGLGVSVLNERAERTNEVVRKLLNENAVINNYLLSMMLYRLYLQEETTKFERLMVLPKVERQIKIYEGLEGLNFKEIRKTTSRVADNIWRVFTGKAQLSDEIRDLRAKKFNKEVA